jgi:hypothetical protein
MFIIQETTGGGPLVATNEGPEDAIHIVWTYGIFYL